MRAIDLFAGAGGLSLGLRQAGIEVIAAIERDPDACATYRAHLGDHMIEASIEDVDAHILPDCDLIAGGPPCQGFSFAGKRDRNDPRNQLWREYWRIVDAKRPAWVLIENVRGMLTMGEDKPLILAFRALGYEITPYLLNAADYGVPQKRLRVFYIGNRIGAANPCPTPTHAQPPRHLLLGLQPWVTVRQALDIGAAKVGNVPTHAGRHGSLNRPEREPGSFILDEPSRALRAGAHGQPGYSPRHIAGYVPTTRTDHGVLDLDEPSCAIKAGGNREADGHMGGACPPEIGLPNIPLDQPSPTILGCNTEKSGHQGGAEPIRHRLRGRWAEHGDGSTVDEPAPTVSTDRGLEEHWLSEHYEVAPTIQADSRVSRPGHHGPNDPRMMLRRLTVRECAKLQDFPDWYEFHGSKTSQYRQVGNAVAVGMARAIGETLMHNGGGA